MSRYSFNELPIKTVFKSVQLDRWLFTENAVDPSSAYYMDTRVMGYFGFISDAGRYCGNGGEAEYLAAKNDLGATFAEIADIIEQNADTLFEKE